MIRKHIIKLLSPTMILFALVFTANTANAENEHNLVMVTSNFTEVSSLTRKELRRLYLGIDVIINENKISPIRNHSNDVLHEAFLQKFMFMSSGTYERQLNLRTIRRGLKPPAQLSTHKEIVNALIIQKNSVAYMWEDQAAKNPNIRILKTR